MRLISARFRNYKVLVDEGVSFRDENPFFFSKPNEYGKSTIIEGIRDAFRLKPEELEKKKSAGAKVSPTVEVDFEIDGETYTLRLNAQDKTLTLKGSDGTDLTTQQSIENFLKTKGYGDFPAVLEKLLILRERDLSVATSKGLGKLLDSVLHSGRINSLDKRIREIVGKKKNLIGNFGREKKEIEKELERISGELTGIEQKIAEHERDLGELKNLKEKYRDIGKKIERIERTKKELELIIPYKKYELLKKDVENLEKGLNERNRRIEVLDKFISQKEKECDNLEKELDKIKDRIREIDNRSNRIELLKSKLEKLKEESKNIARLKKLKEELGKWANYGFKDLHKYFVLWKQLKELKEQSRGRIDILKAAEKVKIDGRVCEAGKGLGFEGQATVEYKDLTLQVIINEDIFEKEKYLRKQFGSPEELERLVTLAKEKELIEGSFKKELPDENRLGDEIKKISREIETLEDISENIDELKKREKEISSRLSQIRKELEKTHIEKSRLIGGNDQIVQSLKSRKAELEELSERIEELESLITIGLLKNYEGRKIRELEELLRKTEDEFMKTSTEARGVSERIAHLKGKTSHEPDRSNFEKLLEKKLKLEKKLIAFNRMERVLNHTLYVLDALKKEIDRKYVLDFQKKTSEIFSEITDGAYNKVDFETQTLFFNEDEFNRRWKAVRRDGHIFSIDELSDGTSSQLLLSARLALVELLLHNKAFLLLDEPLAYFDNKRSMSTINTMKKLANSGWQIIVMSAKEGI